MADNDNIRINEIISIEDEWYAYRENTLIDIALDWCELKKHHMRIVDERVFG